LPAAIRGAARSVEPKPVWRLVADHPGLLPGAPRLITTAFCLREI
jgi:hypothetical protein